jgi:hypothetical protein
MLKPKTPKFLTKQIAKQAVKSVLKTVFKTPIGELLEQQDLHIVVLVPAMKNDWSSVFPQWPNYEIEPTALYQKSVGDRKKWKYPFDDLARNKALQLWQGRNDDRTDIMPHLLFSGDVPYWGGVKRHSVVVTCSGPSPWLDKMISGMIADMIVGLAYDAWMKSPEKKAGEVLIQ